MNKKGFLQIPILVCLGLLALSGLLWGVVKTKDSILSVANKTDKLEVKVDKLGSGGGTVVSTLGTNIDLTSEVTGVLPQANGGSNASTDFTAGSVIFDDGTRFVQDNAN